MSTWVIPCNTKYYDHKGAFEKLTEVDWRQSANMEVGDIVYIYVGRPISSLLYKCEIIKTNMDDTDGSDNEFILGESLKKAKRYMRVRLLEKYPEGKFDRVSLLENGLKTIQGPSKVESDFIGYIEGHK